MHHRKHCRSLILFYVNCPLLGMAPTCFQCKIMLSLALFGFALLRTIVVMFDSRYCPVGRSFYSPDLGRRQPLGEGLESWRGFYQSIRPTQMGLSLNIGNVFFFLVPQLLNKK